MSSTRRTRSCRSSTSRPPTTRTAQTTRELAEQRLEAEQTKFSLGTSTLRFVLEEQRNVAQAQTNELQNVVNFTKSLVDLDKAMGLSLKKNNIEIDKTLGQVAVK